MVLVARVVWLRKLLLAQAKSVEALKTVGEAFVSTEVAMLIPIAWIVIPLLNWVAPVKKSTWLLVRVATSVNVPNVSVFGSVSPST